MLLLFREQTSSQSFPDLGIPKMSQKLRPLVLGVIFLQQRKFQAAERQIGLAIGLQPKIAAAHYNRGVALMYLDRQEEALASFNSAIALKPDYDLAITQRDNISKATGRIRSDRSR